MSLNWKFLLFLCCQIIVISYGQNGPMSLNVLWIGNSYTYYHDLPTIVQDLATNAGRVLTFTQRTEGGWTWEKVCAQDH